MVLIPWRGKLGRFVLPAMFKFVGETKNDPMSETPLHAPLSKAPTANIKLG